MVETHLGYELFLGMVETYLSDEKAIRACVWIIGLWAGYVKAVGRLLCAGKDRRKLLVECFSGEAKPAAYCPQANGG